MPITAPFMAVNDVYAIVNAMVREMYGANTVANAMDTKTFLDIGTTALAGMNGVENTFNALSLVLAKTIIGVRPYKGDLQVITKNSESYGYYTRKISYFTKLFEATDSEPTNLNANALKDGTSVDHYRINKMYPLEVDFKGSKALQKSYTRFRWQVKKAFTSEAEFSKFVEGFMIEVANEIELAKESENRLTLLGYIASLHKSTNAKMHRNMLDEYNAFSGGTSYVVADVMPGGSQEVGFLKFFIAEWTKQVEMLKRNTTIYHQTPTMTDDNGNTLDLLRHTPANKLRAVAYAPYFIDAKINIMPEIFNPKLIEAPNHEEVMYWQNPNKPIEVNIAKPNYFDPATGTIKASTTNTTIKPLAVLFDEDAVGVNYQVEDTVTTPVNARGEYVNTFIHWRKNYWADMTENGVLFYLP